MLAASTDLQNALTDSGGRRWRVSAYRGADLLLYDIPTQPFGDITLDGTGSVQASGTINFADGGTGESLVPDSLTDPLAPAGQELLVEYVVDTGTEEWATPVGKFPITSVPDMDEYRRRFASRLIILQSTVVASIRDRFDTIQRSEFLQPESPKSTSTWAEIQRLSPIPIVRNLPDVLLPSGLAYTDSRADALTTLIANLGAAVPSITRQGYLTARLTDRWLTATVPDFEIVGVVHLGRSMTNNLFNAVRVRTVIGDNTILSIKTIDDPRDPLYVGGPFGVRTYGYSSPLITDQASADAAATTILNRVSTQHQRKVVVECLPNPLIELGDWGTATDDVSGLTVSGEVSRMSFSLDPLATMKLELTGAEVTQ